LAGRASALLAAAAAGLLVACVSIGSPDSSEFASGSVGTWNDAGGKMGLAFIVAANPVPEGVVRVTLTTPDPVVLERSYRVRTLFPQTVPTSGWWYDSLTPRSGTYRLEAFFPGGKSARREMPVDVANRLEAVGSPALFFTSSQAIVRWQAAQGARAYWVELWRLDEGMQPAVRHFELMTTDLELRVDPSPPLPAGTYRARIFALNANPGDFGDLRDRLRSQFNVSSVWTAPVTRGSP
jgi:hypothetical protein